MTKLVVIKRKIDLVQEGNALKALVNRVDKDKPSTVDLKALQKSLDRLPELWRIRGDIYKLAVEKLIDTLANQVFIKECMKRGVEDVKDRLGYKYASGAEILLIEACAIAWLRYYVTEYLSSVNATGDQSFAQADFYDRKLGSAQQRYLKALETLAKIRRLALPILQVNVSTPGANQINVQQRGRPAKILDGNVNVQARKRLISTSSVTHQR